jgi:hypothetical protein
MKNNLFIEQPSHEIHGIRADVYALGLLKSFGLND